MGWSHAIAEDEEYAREMMQLALSSRHPLVQAINRMQGRLHIKKRCSFAASFHLLAKLKKVLVEGGLVVGTFGLLIAAGTDIFQGCHGTGKTGNLKVHFSRQGKHREFAKKY